MATRGKDQALGIGLIVLGALTYPVVLLAAFTPIGLLVMPFGAGLVLLGTRRLNRAARSRS